MKDVMQFEKTRVVKPLIKRKFMAQQTNDLRKLSTLNIMRFVYKRHEVGILQLVATGVLIVAIVSNL